MIVEGAFSIGRVSGGARMKIGDEGVVLGRVRVVVREVYLDGTAYVEVLQPRVPDVDANVKHLAPGMRFNCSQKAVLLDMPLAS
jgi:hypothetical protein